MSTRGGTGDVAGEATRTDERFMAAAIRLSLRNLRLTAENPSVGSLIVAQDGTGASRIVGHGVTAPGGRPHAELQALAEAGEAARGATAYATLEPCSHIGKAPPCADALVRAGLRRVVIGTLDPDIRVAGRGVAILREAGLEVVVGCLEREARRAMSGFLSLRGKGRPWVTLKLAVSTDGMIGRRGAGQVAITGPEARRAAQAMRYAHEGIMVGVGTVLEDDPRLDLRLPGLEAFSPRPVVVDSFARTPPAARIFDRPGRRPILLASEKADRRRLADLRDRGAEPILLASDFRGRFQPREMLRALGVLGMRSVLLEGGAATAKAFLDAGLVDGLSLFGSDVTVGEGGVAAPVASDAVPADFSLVRTHIHGADWLHEYERQD
jgi:diaminohydroxyphosphoribosylaminopyrimidine deaminase/5-amino-6-(5-phosphoribosylamino)uracil reductase